MTTPLLLLGESPPPGAPPDFRPFDCASGDRLAKLMLGLRSRAPLLEHVRIVNVFDEPGTGITGKGPRWDPEAAQARGREVYRLADGGTIVALGEKPRHALGLLEDLRVGSIVRVRGVSDGGYVDVLAMPHPSGRGQALNTEPQRSAVRRALLPEVVAACPGLRPWNFILDVPAILVDLAVACSPLRPWAAAAGLVYAAERQSQADAGSVLRRIAIGANGLPGDATPAEVTRLVGRAIGIGDDDVKQHRQLRERAKFAARTLQFAEVDPAVLRATSLRLAALGVA